LQVHPELRRCANEVSEPHRSVGSKIALTFQDLRDAIGGHIDFRANAAALMDKASSSCKSHQFISSSEGTFRLEGVKKLANVHIQLLLRMLLIYTVEL
jgi:hypothetical protein